MSAESILGYVATFVGSGLLTSVGWGVLFSNRLTRMEANQEHMAASQANMAAGQKEIKKAVENFPSQCAHHTDIERRLGSMESKLHDGLESRVARLEALKEKDKP